MSIVYMEYSWDKNNSHSLRSVLLSLSACIEIVCLLTPLQLSGKLENQTQFAPPMMAQQFPLSPQSTPAAAFTTLIPFNPPDTMLAEQMKAVTLSGNVVNVNVTNAVAYHRASTYSTVVIVTVHCISGSNVGPPYCFCPMQGAKQQYWIHLTMKALKCKTLGTAAGR